MRQSADRYRDSNVSENKNPGGQIREEYGLSDVQRHVLDRLRVTHWPAEGMEGTQGKQMAFNRIGSEAIPSTQTSKILLYAAQAFNEWLLKVENQVPCHRATIRKAICDTTASAPSCTDGRSIVGGVLPMIA